MLYVDSKKTGVIIKILSLFLCLLLCGCTTDSSFDDTDNSLAIEEKNEARHNTISIDSFEEFEQLLSFIESDLETDGINKRDSIYGVIMHKNEYITPISAKAILKTIDIVGYPWFDDAIPDTYCVEILPMEALGYESKIQNNQFIPQYTVEYVKAEVAYYIDYYAKYCYNFKNYDSTYKYLNEVEIDGTTVSLYEKQGKLFCAIDICDEYFVRFMIRAYGSTRAISVDEVNFDGVHLFR